MDKDTLLAIALAKKGGGGGSSSYTETVIYDGDAIPGDTITLNDSYKNYDALVFVLFGGNNPETGNPSFASSPYISTGTDIGTTYIMDIGYGAEGYDYGLRIGYKILSYTSLNWLADSELIKVIGIKFG